MGLLFLDITAQGVIMGCDSRDVVLVEGDFQLPPQPGSRRKNRIISFEVKGFVGYLGYVGTEVIGAREAKQWFKHAVADLKDLSPAEFCQTLAERLTAEWTTYSLQSGLWVFVAGYEGPEARFWFVNNIDGQEPQRGLYVGIRSRFEAVNDLDENYIRPRLVNGKTKDDVLGETIFNFRNGVIFPFVAVYDAFNEVLKRLHAGEPGFARLNTLDKLAFIGRQRLEFVKRLYSEKHGIYNGPESPIGGDVFVLAMDPAGRRWRCDKNRFAQLEP